MFEKILIAHDGSDTADRALDTAIEMACRFSAALHMISVEEDLPQYARTIDDVDQEKEAEDSYFALLGARSKQRARVQPLEIFPISNSTRARLKCAMAGIGLALRTCWAVCFWDIDRTG